MDIVMGLLPFLGPFLLLLIGGLIGRAREQAHLKDLTEREKQLAPITTVDIKAIPGGLNVAAGGYMVVGNVVIASDYLKNFLAQMRNLVGGEVKSLTPLLERGRREARLRMVEQAQQLGADLIINVRFETSTVAMNAAEVICYGTALRRN